MATRIEYEVKLRDYPDVVTIKELMLTIISPYGIVRITCVSEIRPNKPIA